jgi:quercetin dioxygenase-like cupin family protein
LESWDIRSLAVEPHKPQVLRSDDEARLIAINLPAGDRLQDHRVHERAYLMVVDGDIEVTEGDQTESGGAGYLAEFDPNERREVRATSDARVLLILAPWPGEGHSSQRAGGGDPQAA